MRYLVTGGAGFIGTHLVRRLLEVSTTTSIEVWDIRQPSATDPRVRYREVDLRSPEPSEDRDGFDVCYHLAALCKEPGHSWDEYFETNHAGTRRLCGVLPSLGVERVVFASTMMVFRAQEATMNEESLAAPETAYGMSKLLAEKELEIWAATNPVRSLQIVRPGVVFGRGEGGNFTRLYRALKRRRFAYVGRKDTVKGCVYVKDVVGCLEHLSRTAERSGVYNLVIPGDTTVQTICESMVRATGLSNRVIPTVPYGLALAAGYAGELASFLGLRSAIHHRRIQKLHVSTKLSSEKLLRSGFELKYDLPSALADWHADCGFQELR